MKTIFLSLIFLLISDYALANPIQFIPQTISFKDSLFNGNLPCIKNKEFSKLNKQIRSDILKDVDGVRIEFDSTALFQNDYYLTLQVHKEIQGGRSYSREQYFVIDLKQKKILNLLDILNRYDIAPSEIENQILKQLKAAHEAELSHEGFEYFEDYLLSGLASFYNEYPEFINLTKDSNFYLNNNILGISFDLGVASYAFEFKIAQGRVEAIF
jgi:hypothetical protein